MTDLKELERLAGEYVWLIQVRRGYWNGRGVWSRPGHCGYTDSIHEAGRFSMEEAKELASASPEKYEAVCLPLAPLAGALPALLELVKCQHDALERLVNTVDEESPWRTWPTEKVNAFDHARAALAKYNDMMEKGDE